jgi:hypothetical protein
MINGVKPELRGKGKKITPKHEKLNCVPAIGLSPKAITAG